MGNQPIKKFKSGAIEGVVWNNKRKISDDMETEFKTVTLRRMWKDKEKDIWRDEKINLRKHDIAKCILILNKLQEELLLNKEDDKDDE